MPGLERRLLIVEDEKLMASLLETTLVGAGFGVAVASNVLDALDQVERFDPDIALLDISLGDGPSGLDLAHLLNAQHPDVAIIFLTKHPDPRTAGVQSVDMPPGAGFMRKDMVTNSAYLLEAIEAVLADRPRDVRHDLTPTSPLRGLTDKQLTVLQLASQGLTNAAIARRLDKSERAVVHLLKAVFEHLGIADNADVNQRVEAVRIYVSTAGVPSRK